MARPTSGRVFSRYRDLRLLVVRLLPFLGPSMIRRQATPGFHLAHVALHLNTNSHIQTTGWLLNARYEKDAWCLVGFVEKNIYAFPGTFFYRFVQWKPPALKCFGI